MKTGKMREEVEKLLESIKLEIGIVKCKTKVKS